MTLTSALIAAATPTTNPIQRSQGVGVELPVEILAAKIPEREGKEDLQPHRARLAGDLPHLSSFRVNGEGSANTPGVPDQGKDAQNRLEAARKVILSLLSRRRPLSVRTKFHSSS